MFALQTNLKFLLLGGGADPLEEVTVNNKEENSFVPITSKNSVSVVAKVTFLIFLKSYYAVPGLCEPSVNMVRGGVSVFNSLLHPYRFD